MNLDTPPFEHAKKRGRKFQNPIETRVGSLGMLPKILKLYLKNKEERTPRRQLGPFKTDARLYKEAPASGLRVTWLGHSSSLVEIDGLRILIDPLWDERASPFGWTGPKRFFAASLALDELPALDVVLVSHDHYDHLGKQTIRALARLAPAAKARWVTSLGVGKRLVDFGLESNRITELDWTQSLTVTSTESGAELKITSLPARHFSGRTMWDRFETLWASFVLTGNRHNVYFGADSGMWDGFNRIGREYGPFDLTMLEIGAYNKLWESIHLGPDGAAHAFAALGKSGLLMPIHWGLFQLAPQGWKQPMERLIEVADQLGIKLWAPEMGVPTEVTPESELRSTWWKV